MKIRIMEQEMITYQNRYDVLCRPTRAIARILYQPRQRGSAGARLLLMGKWWEGGTWRARDLEPIMRKWGEPPVGDQGVEDPESESF